MWAALLYSTPPAMADFSQAIISELTADPAGSTGRQGFSVAVSADGNTAIVGAPFDGSGAGTAWVFTRSGGKWTRQQQLAPDDATECSEQVISACPQFGWAVALSADGNTAIVGGPGDKDSTGAAWVFTRRNGIWDAPGVKLVGTNAVGNAEQGYSVALSANGTTAIIGGWADNSALGAAWVFRRSGATWNQQGAKLVSTDTTATSNILQGFSVALSGNGKLAIIGGPNDGYGAPPNDVARDGAIGAAWLFGWDDTSRKWLYQTKLVGMNGTAKGNESEQGFSVALSRDGSTAIVGGPGDETLGPATSDAISQTCSVKGETSPETCTGTLTTATETMVHRSDGAAWVFALSSGVWGPGIKLTGTPAPGSSPGQGFSVALSDNGKTVLLGGPADNANTGATWAFTLTNGTWTPQANMLVGTGAVGAAGQGASVALSRDGTTAIIGGPLDSDRTGAAWVFLAQDPLKVSLTGDGTVTSNLPGIDCTATSATCGATYTGDTMVTLLARPDHGYIFVGWSGACSGSGSCVVTMSMAKNVTATFAAAPMRSYVSGVGDDANPCSRTAACKTFAGAISKTGAGGEIDCLDPGGFGTVIITNAITLDCQGSVGGILASGTNGITIDAANTDLVILRNLSINGTGTTLGIRGISILSAGAVTIENLHITNFSQQAIADTRSTAGALTVINTDAHANLGAGLGTATSGGTLQLLINGFHSFDNGYGVALSTNTNAVIRNSVLSDNTTAGIDNEGARIAANDNAITGNGVGVRSLAGTTLLSNNDIALNATAVDNASGYVVTYGNNRDPGSVTGTIIAAGGVTSNLGER